MFKRWNRSESRIVIKIESFKRWNCSKCGIVQKVELFNRWNSLKGRIALIWSKGKKMKKTFNDGGQVLCSALCQVIRTVVYSTRWIDRALNFWFCKLLTCDCVVKSEDTGVYLYVGELHEVLQPSDQVQHLRYWTVCPLLPSSPSLTTNQELV